MDKTHDMPHLSGSKIFVAHSKKSKVSKNDLTDLLLEADQGEQKIKFIDPDNEAQVVELSQGDKLIVPLESVIINDDAIERLVLAATRTACAIIGVWPAGATEGSIHSAVAKFGIAQIPWDADKMKDAIGVECPPPYETPDGRRSEPHHIKRNKC